MRRETAPSGGPFSSLAPALGAIGDRGAQVAVLVAVVALAVLGCTDDGAKSAPATHTSTAADADMWGPLTPTAPSPPSTSAPPAQQNWPQVGDEASDGDLSFVVTQHTGSNTAVDPDDPENPYLKTHSQNLYLMVYLRVKNISHRPQTFYASNQRLRTTDREFAADERAAINSGAYRIDINPGNTVDTILAFDLPPDLLRRTDTGFSLKVKFIELHSSSTSPGVIVSLKRRGQ